MTPHPGDRSQGADRPATKRDGEFAILALLTDTRTAVSAMWDASAYDLMQQEGAAQYGRHRLVAADDRDAIRLAATWHAGHPGQTVVTRTERGGRVIVVVTFD